jgi:hypothetical protein
MTRSPTPDRSRILPCPPGAKSINGRLTADSPPPEREHGATWAESPLSRRAAAALAYARAGLPVLPLYEIRTGGGCACDRPGCDRPGKHPRLPRGVHNASTEPTQVMRWWRWWPDANVGAATGHLFDAWDIDLPADAACDLLARYLGNQAASWPSTRTGSGGTHVFVHPTGLGNRVKFLPGCDWRGRGGYVVLPPSGHASGEAYEWLAGPQVNSLANPDTAVAFPLAPVGLREALQPQPLRATPARPWHANRTAPYAEAALRRECDSLAAMPADSGRNNALNRAAFNLGQLVAVDHLGYDDAAEALAVAAAACGLSPREAQRTIASGLAAGQRNPRTVRRSA